MKKQIKKMILTLLVYAPVVSISFAARAALSADTFSDQDDLQLIKVNNTFYRIEKIRLEELDIDPVEIRNIPDLQGSTDLRRALEKMEKFYSGSSPSDRITK